MSKDLIARIEDCLANTRESFDLLGEDLLAEAAQALRRASEASTLLSEWRSRYHRREGPSDLDAVTCALLKALRQDTR